jgi:uncharacterized protein (DUF302 family)
MEKINFKRELKLPFDEAITRTTEALKTQGFGVLSRIDFHSKIKEKLGKDLPPIVILGACNPSLAYEAFLHNKDVTSLLPCNVVVRDIGQGQVSIEFAKPTLMMAALGDPELVAMAQDADRQLLKALENI